MPMPLRPSRAGPAEVSRPLVAGLFVSSVLLSVVSWYTTQQGMALYLSPWFSFLASLGVQSALVLVAWLVGVTESRRGLLIAVYAVTAVVSIAFSYVSLHTWFASRERPATIERALYDELNAAAGKSQELAHRRRRRGAEARARARGDDDGREGARLHLARHGPGPVPLAGPRGGGPRGRELRRLLPRGPGRRGCATRPSTGTRASPARRWRRLQESQRSLADFRAGLKPLDPTEQQLRAFRQVFDAIPWSDVRDTLHARVELPAVPAYSAFVDRSATGQEDLIIAFTELLSAPTSRHVLALTLATFIDLIVFLLAYASGPFFFGAPEERWLAGGRRARLGGRAGLRPGPPAQGLPERLRAWPGSTPRPSARASCSSCCCSRRGGSRPRRGGRRALLPARRLGAPDARRVAGRPEAPPPGLGGTAGRRLENPSAGKPGGGKKRFLPGAWARVQSPPCTYRLSTG